MISKIQKITCAGIVCLGALSASATPTLSLSVSSLQSDADSVLTHTITGISSGETVKIERFADLNGNGIIDSGEPSLRTYSVTDGLRPMIGGVLNANVPGDDDATVDGKIRVGVLFPGVDSILGRQPGKYVIRVTSSTGHADQPFQVTAPSLPQRITGVVRNQSNKNPIPFAVIVILVGDGKPVGSVRADAAGSYTFIAPPGGYALLPFADGFVASFDPVNLPASQVVSHDLLATPASVRVTGKVSSQDSGAGLPGVFVIAQTPDSGSQFIGGALTDGSGNYALSVTSGSWEIHPQSEFVAELGYVGLKNGPTIVAASSPLTQDFSMPKATALIYGNIIGPSSNPIPGLSIRGRLDLAQRLETYGRTTDSGNYCIAMNGGSIDLQSEGATLLGLRDFSRTETVDDGHSIRADFNLTAFTAHLLGKVVDSSGGGIGGVTFNGYFGDNNHDSSTRALTAADGSFDLPVWGGSWYFELSQDDAASRGLINHFVRLDFVDSVNQTITFVAPSSTAHISGVIQNASSQPLANLGVQGSATIGGVDYETSAQTDSSGHYQLPAINGMWNVFLDCQGLEQMNYECPPTQFVTINNSNGTADFTVAPFRVTATLNGKVVDGVGAPVANLDLAVFPDSGGPTRNGSSGADGAFSLPVFGGNWILQVSGNAPPGKIAPSLQFTVTDGVDINNIQFKLLDADATITGSIKNSTGGAVGGVQIFASVEIDGIDYFAASPTSDASGNFVISANRNATWFLNLECGPLESAGYNCPMGIFADTTSGSARADFVVTAIGPPNPPSIESPHLNSAGVSPVFQFVIRGDVGTYDVFGAPAIPFSWTGLSTVTIGPGQSTISVSVLAGSNHFFRVALRN